jgi:hypothetical protein
MKFPLQESAKVCTRPGQPSDANQVVEQWRLGIEFAALLPGERMAERRNVKPPNSGMASLHKSERREERFALPFEIDVSGINGDGEVFHITLQTRNASQWGCGFLSPIELRTDDIVAIRVASPGGPVAVQRLPIRFQVVRVDSEAGGWAIGAWKMEPDDVWGIELEGMAQPQGGEVILRRRSVEDEDHESGDE